MIQDWLFVYAIFLHRLGLGPHPFAVGSRFVWGDLDISCN